MHKWQPEELEFLKANIAGTSYRNITDEFNRKFGLNVTYDQMKSCLSRKRLHNGISEQFKPGFETWNKGKTGYMGANKGSFYKGMPPINHRVVGSKRVNVDGYVEIKIAEPQKWEPLHRHLWEKTHNHRIPENSVIIFADQNKRNFDPDNLVLVKRSELVILNKRKLIFDDPESTKAGLNIAKVLVKTSDLKKSKRRHPNGS